MAGWGEEGWGSSKWGSPEREILSSLWSEGTQLVELFGAIEVLADVFNSSVYVVDFSGKIEDLEVHAVAYISVIDLFPNEELLTDLWLSLVNLSYPLELRYSSWRSYIKVSDLQTRYHTLPKPTTQYSKELKPQVI